MSNKLIVKYLDPNTGKYQDATVADIGDLANLQTKTKTNLVDAINSIQGGGGSLPDGIQDQLDDINGKLSDLEDSGLNDLEKEEIQKRIEKAVNDLNADIALIQKDYDAASEIIHKISEDTLADLENIKTDYNDKVIQITEDLNLSKDEIKKTKNDLLTAKEKLNSIDADYVTVTQEVDKINGVISQKVDSADFNEIESRIEHNETEITQTKKDITLKASQESLDYSNSRIEKAEAEIAINKDAITQKVTHEQMQEEIDKVGTYGKNYLMHTRDWYEWNPNDALRVYPTSDVHDHVDILVVERAGYYVSRVVDEDLVVGETYTASINAKTDESGTPSKLSFFEKNNAYPMKDELKDVDVNDEWKRMSVSFVATEVRPEVSFRFTEIPSDIKGMLSGAKVEKGPKASPWEANSNDDSTAIVKANSEIKQTAGRITSAVSRITETENGIIDANSRIDQTDKSIKLQAKQITELDGKVSETEASLTVANDSIKTKVSQTDVDKSIEGIQLDNQNRILNSDFSLDLEHWNEIDSGFKLVEVNGLKYVGINRSGLTSDKIASMASSKFPVKDKQRLMIGFDMIVDNLSAYDVKKPFILELYDINDVRVDIVQFKLEDFKGTLSNGKVTRLNGVYKVDREDVAKGRIRLSLNRNGSVKYTRIMLQAGDLDSTEWSAAPEDSQLIRAKLETSIDQTAEAIKLTATKAELDKTNEQVRLQEGSLEVQSGKIEGVVKDVTTASSKISVLTQTSQGLTSTVGELSTDNITNKANISQLKQDAKTFAVTVGETYSTKDDLDSQDKAQASKLSQLQLDLNGFKTTVVDNYPDNTKMASQIKQSAKDIISTVSQSYQPKGDYATPGYVASQIEQKADSITSTISSNVSKQYSTKTETEAKINLVKSDLSKLGSNVAYSWSETGYDRFTKVKPELSIVKKSTKMNTSRWNTSYGTYTDNAFSNNFASSKNSKKVNDSSTNILNYYINQDLKPNTEYTATFFYRSSINIYSYIYPNCNSEAYKSGNSQVNTRSDTQFVWGPQPNFTPASFSFKTPASLDGGIKSFLFRMDDISAEGWGEVAYLTLKEGKSTIWVTDIEEDYDNSIPRYIGHGIKDSINPSDYSWSINPERRSMSAYAQDEMGRGFSLVKYNENLISESFKPISISDPVSQNFKYHTWGTKLLPNTVYTFSSEIKLSGDNSADQLISAIVYTSDIKKGVVSKNLKTDGTRQTFTFRTNDVECRLLVYAGLQGKTAKNTAVYSNSKIELGYNATAWTPSIEDVESTSNEYSYADTAAKYIGSAKLPYLDYSKYDWKLNPDWLSVNTKTLVTDQYSQSVQDLNGFRDSVGKTYQSKDAMTGYYNKTQVDSQITQSEGRITASVKSYADDKSTNAKNDAVSNAKSYTDGQIKITNQAITSTVSSLTTSGGNLFNDSKGVDNWSMATVSSTSQEQINESASPYGKAKYIKMPTGGGGPHKVPYATIVGETYSFSVFIKANTSGTLTLGSEKGGTINAAVTTSWKRFTHTFVAQDTQYGSFVFYRQSNANNITDLYIHSPTFVQGSIIPNWSESVEDTALKSEIKQTATDITFNVKGYADEKAADAKNAAINEAKTYTNSQIQVSEKGITSTVSETYTTKDEFSKALVYKGDLTGSQSADNLAEGWYNVSSWTGIGGTSWGKMQVYNSGGGHKSQVYVAGGGNTYTRAYQGSPASWSSWQKSTDTKTIISTINQSPESISISAEKINLKGAVTIEALATDAKDKLNNTAKQIDVWRKPNTTKIDGGNIYADSLSVISSNIGTVNAGTINGVKITSTANDNSRIELNGGNFRAYSSDGSWTEHTTNGLKNYAATGNNGTNNKPFGFDMNFTGQGLSISPWGQNENLARNVGIDLYGDNTYMDFHNAKYGNNVDNAGRLWMKENSVFELTSSVGDLVVTASSNTQVVARDGSVNLQGKSVNVRNSTNTGYVTIYAAAFSQQSTHSSKTNFKDISTVTLLEAVEGTDIVQYQFKDQVINGNPEDMIGFVINDDKKSPYNTTDLIVNNDGTGFDTTTAVGIMMGAIKELSKRNKELEAKVDTFDSIMKSIDLEKITKQ